MTRVNNVNEAVLAELVLGGKRRRPTAPTSECPSKEALQAFLLDYPLHEERAAIVSHIDSCKRCGDEVASFHEVLDELFYTPLGQQEVLRLRQRLSAPSVRSLDASFERLRERFSASEEYALVMEAKDGDPVPLERGTSDDGVTTWTIWPVRTKVLPLARSSSASRVLEEWEIHFKSRAPLCFAVTAAGQRQEIRLEPFSPSEFNGAVKVPAGTVPSIEPLEPEAD